MSFVGKTEAELTAAAIPYEVGVSRYRELARGQIAGDSHGMLKLLMSSEDRKLLGAHVFGTGATENVRIGQAVMGCGGTVDYLIDAVLNYPTLAEAYKVAAMAASFRLSFSAADGGASTGGMKLAICMLPPVELCQGVSARGVSLVGEDCYDRACTAVPNLGCRRFGLRGEFAEEPRPPGSGGRATFGWCFRVVRQPRAARSSRGACTGCVRGRRCRW